MEVPRTCFAAVTCGKNVVAMGGYDRKGLPVDIVEIYNPREGWRHGRKLSFARGMIASAVL
jgi:hypothetical protein